MALSHLLQLNLKTLLCLLTASKFEHNHFEAYYLNYIDNEKSGFVLQSIEMSYLSSRLKHRSFLNKR